MNILFKHKKKINAQWNGKSGDLHKHENHHYCPLAVTPHHRAKHHETGNGSIYDVSTLSRSFSIYYLCCDTNEVLRICKSIQSHELWRFAALRIRKVSKDMLKFLLNVAFDLSFILWILKIVAEKKMEFYFYQRESICKFNFPVCGFPQNAT